MGRIGSELWIISRFQMFALRMLLLCVGSGDFLYQSLFICDKKGVISGDDSRGLCPPGA